MLRTAAGVARSACRCRLLPIVPIRAHALRSCSSTGHGTGHSTPQDTHSHTSDLSQVERLELLTVKLKAIKAEVADKLKDIRHEKSAAVRKTPRTTVKVTGSKSTTVSASQSKVQSTSIVHKKDLHVDNVKTSVEQAVIDDGYLTDDDGVEVTYADDVIFEAPAQHRTQLKKKGTTMSNAGGGEPIKQVLQPLSATKTSSSSQPVKTVSHQLPSAGEKLKLIEQFPLFCSTQGDNSAASLSDSSVWGFSEVLSGVLGGLPRPPSVTKVLGDTQSEESRLQLQKWEQRMIAEMGVDGFKKYKKELFANGHNFHECVGEHVQFGTDISDLQLASANEGLWESVTPVLEHISDVRLVEGSIDHPVLGYKGVIDCVASYRKRPVVIDWKTSSRAKSSLSKAYDDPLQLAAYLGAFTHTPLYDVQVEGALLVVCYRDGRQAHTLYMSRDQCNAYWKQWLLRLHTFYSMQLKQGR